MSRQNVKIGIVGLGRLGRIHARNLTRRIEHVELLAICDDNESNLKECQEDLSVANAYSSYASMLKNPEIDAVVIVTPSALHCTQIEAALEAGKHVFCEKPLGVDKVDSEQARQAVVRHREKVFMLGFMRRYDPSYMYAKKKVDQGAIGKPVLFRSYSVDPISAIDSILAYIPQSAGQFVDMAVHDIDLARWFLKSEPKSIYAVGGCYAYPQFGEYQDGDNVAAMMQFENESMAFLLAGRTAPHGYNVETEIIGTKATLRIGSVPQKNLVEIIGTHGITRECSQTFDERFEQAFINEMQEFVNCIREGRKPGITVEDGVRASEIAELATDSFRENKLIKL
jgi:myo-inositol 2-dehydrogenase/D-chiro-inositol 1-dehydrogenase